ncbi:MAG TPA: phosphate ABC transporter permease PstA [Candidatus Polarisedimenticolaceae bacterium]|nr:phosphate ABC transporter permease PstA [Candidatus Polarisedimenticolaceae bacterium]
MRTSFRRRASSAVVTAFCGLAVVLALVPLGWILFFVVRQGLPALDLAFFTHLPKPVGEAGGGMANALAGTGVLLGLASLLAVPLGILCGMYVAEYRRTWLATAVRSAADLLNGTPSIVIGIFAYSVAVLPFQRFSALAGSLALALMMLPLIVRTTEELLLLVPDGLRQGALALGASRARAVLTVVLPAALPGILTGILVALARIAGETAPLLFTAFNNRYWSLRVDQPIASLTVQVYTYAISPYDDWHRQAWAGATVLIGAVLLFSLLARLATRRLQRMHRG